MQNECQVLRKSIRTAKENRRYRLHQKIGKVGVRYNSNLKTIYVPFDDDLQNKDILELQKNFNYQIQLEI
ncbi:hypothetical protein OIU80_19330 [Flavobacterium sp. LS1R47]|uniref:Uncharacterized protein n=1 Tax=Flavobacterium frigoritolerans TaxID=2987686 RepID=A0A9X3CA81_9FLAO|nr:hypothetical protein [Flavobacterium frigoritolerans]MCV9934438.1 hypothetical protein [Flavobacterium frigoritolerans]